MTASFPPSPGAAAQVTIRDGRRLAVWTVGSGLPVVLLHGFPLDHAMWEGQTALVAPGGGLAGRARLIIPDLAGFGASDGPPTATIAGMADDVVALLDGLGIAEPAVVCGLSMGGYVAQHLAANHPGRLRGLVLVDTKLEADTPEARAARIDLGERVARVGARIAAEAMVPRLLAARRPGEELAAARDAIEVRLRRTIESTAVATIQGALRALADRPDMAAAAGKFTVPTLLVVGAEDAITPPECLERAARLIPDARLEVVPGSGHMTPLEDPATFNSLLAEYLLTRILPRG